MIFEELRDATEETARKERVILSEAARTGSIKKICLDLRFLICFTRIVKKKNSLKALTGKGII